MKRYLTVFALLILAFGMLPSNGVEAQPIYFSPSFTPYDVIAEVNALRASYGQVPYQINGTLMAIAQAHSEYQASTGTVTHYGVDGSRPYQRALSAGYPVAGDLSQGGFFSENIQAVKDFTAAEVVAAWQGDSPHLTTMISADLRDIGVGMATVDGITYYTLDAGLSTDSVAIIPTSESSAVGNGDPFSVATGTPLSQALMTSTPMEDGSVYHIVQANEALWSIALAYNVSIKELKTMNRLPSDDIYVGQKLLISKKEVATATFEPTITATFGIPTSTATIPSLPTATWTPTPLPTPPASRETGGLIVVGIIFVALLAAGLGAWFGRKKNP
ncbi:MAG: CAP domain-containing protein [Anaerolineales bacterium]